jgi:hypothetical protein
MFPSSLSPGARQNRLNLLANGACAQLAAQDPLAGRVCAELAPNGFYPKPMSISLPRQRLVPRNFADQYAVNDYQPTVPQSYATRCTDWTMNIKAYDNSGVANAAPYQSALPTPSWRETWWRPGALEGPRTGLNDNMRLPQYL